MADKLIWIGCFSAAFSGVLALQRPAVTDAQRIFRIGLVVGGLALAAVGWMMKRRSSG